MSEMVERVAKAIWYDRQPIDTWDGTSLMCREDYRGHARAAIEAMREPTDEMNNAGYFNADHSIEAVGGLAPAPEQQPRLIWQAMIDAALKGETK